MDTIKNDSIYGLFRYVLCTLFPRYNSVDEMLIELQNLNFYTFDIDNNFKMDSEIHHTSYNISGNDDYVATSSTNSGTDPSEHIIYN